MSSSQRREREKQELRGRILDAARELFAEHGFEAVTMRKIAERIEYSPTTIYLHFKDKQALFQELCAVDFLAFARVFERVLKVKDPVERLRKIGLTYVKFGLEHPHHYRLMFMTPHPPVDPEPGSIQKGNPDQDAYALLRLTVEQALEAGALRTDLGDADALAQVLWSGVHGVVALQIAKGNDAWIDWKPVAKTAERMVEAMIHGLAAPRAARRS